MAIIFVLPVLYRRQTDKESTMMELHSCMRTRDEDHGIPATGKDVKAVEKQKLQA